MKPIEFVGMTTTFAKNQPEYLPLPAAVSSDGIVMTCWRFGFWERIRILFTGRMWFSQHTFGDRLQPQRPSVECPFVIGGKIFSNEMKDVIQPGG